MIRVMIADDQAMVRTGFGMIIGAQPDMELVGEAADGVEAVALARRLRPDVALFDIRMPQMDGLEALRLLAGPGVADPIKVVVVTTFDLDEYVHRRCATARPVSCSRTPARRCWSRRSGRRSPATR